MRKLLMAVLAMLMLFGNVLAVSAQDATEADSAQASSGDETAFARGLDAPATYFSERGDAVATITVTDVERGWQEYDEYYEPDPGVEYVAVTFEVEVVSRGNLIVEPYGLSLVDTFGRNNSRSYVSSEAVDILEDDTAVASGETAEMTVVFELYEEAGLGYLMWQPDSGIIVMIDLTEVD